MRDAVSRSDELVLDVRVCGISAGTQYLGMYVYGRSGRPWTVATAA